MDLCTNIVLKVIRENPKVLQIDAEEIQRLFNEECYKKLEKIRDTLCDIRLEDKQCLNDIY